MVYITTITTPSISLATTCDRNQLHTHTHTHDTWDVVCMVIQGLEIRQDHFETL